MLSRPGLYGAQTNATDLRERTRREPMTKGALCIQPALYVGQSDRSTSPGSEEKDSGPGPFIVRRAKHDIRNAKQETNVL